MLSKQDIDAIVEALEERHQTRCPNQCFNAEEYATIRRWLDAMNSTSSWLLKMFLRGVLILLAVGVWAVVNYKLRGHILGG